MTASRWTSPARRACRRAASTCQRAYCRAYSCFGIKCVVAPEMPNNWASPRALPHEDPRGLHPQRAASLSGVGAPRDRPAAARPDDGLPAPGVPERVTAEGSSTLWNPPMRGGSAVSGQATPGNAGAAGFRDHHLQLRRHRRTSAHWTASTAPPFRLACAPCRWKRPRTSSPIIFWRKEIRAGFRRTGTHARRPGTDHGDRRQGRPGVRRAMPFSIASTIAPKGRDGGASGAAGRVEQKVSGKKLRTKGFQIIPDGDRLVLHMPGGGGMGARNGARPGARRSRRARWRGVRCRGARGL